MTFELASSKRAAEEDVTKSNLLPLQDQLSAAASKKKKSCSASRHIDEKSNQTDAVCCTTNKDNNRVPPVPLNSHDMACSKEEYWLPSYTVDQFYTEMCEIEIEDSQGEYGEKISKYYLQAARYAGRISAGDFSQSCHGGDGGCDDSGGNNTASGPIFLLELKDFTPRLTAELAELYKTDKESLDRVVKEAVFRIFKARHKMIFYQYIQGSRFQWGFV